MKYLIPLIAAVFLLTSCNKSKLTEGEAGISQKLLSVCTTPWGQFVAEGTKAVAYAKDFAKCGENCEPIEFDCQQGKLISLKKDNIEITNPASRIKIESTTQSCNKETKCSCVLPNAKGVVSSGVKIQVYSAALAACGDTCSTKKIDVRCENGVFLDPMTNLPATTFNFSCAAVECRSCIAPWDDKLKAVHGGSLTGYVESSLQCGAICQDPLKNSVKFNCADGVLAREMGALAIAASTLKSVCQVNTNCNCGTADAKTFTHDAAAVIKLFQKGIGSCATPCDAGTDYKCLSSVFTKVSDSSKAMNPLYQACTDQCIYCALPDGTKIQQNAQAVIYKTSAGTCAQSCEKMTVKCNVNPSTQKGELAIIGGAGNINDYKLAACSETCVSCSLPDNSKLQEGKTATLFTTTSAGCGQACTSGQVTCDKASATLKLTDGPGVVTDYKYSTCANTCVQCDLPNGTKLDNNSISAQMFSREKVGCGESCASSVANLWCLSGKLRFFGPGAGDVADYKYSSCSGEVCPVCVLPWMTTSSIPQNFMQTRFTKTQALCGESCEDFKVTMKCSNSKFLITAGDPGADLAASVASCNNSVCPTCSFNGRTLNEGDTSLAYKNDGSSCAVGVCSDFIKLKCHNGAMTGGDLGVYKYGACQSSCVVAIKSEVGRTGDESVEGGGANPWLCPMLHSKGFAWGGTKLTYYTRAVVACSDSCNKYKVTVECNNLSGLFSNSNRMLYLQCKENCN